MISQAGSKTPGLASYVAAVGNGLNNTAAEQTIFEVAAGAGYLTKLAASMSGMASFTLRLYTDGAVAHSVTSATNITDLVASGSNLRLAFPQGVVFKTSMKITLQCPGSGSGTMSADYAVSVAKDLL